MQVIIKNAALVRFIEEIAASYTAAYPDRADKFDAMVRAQTAHLVRPTGMSAEGTMMEIGALPTEIYAAVKYVAKKHLKIDDFWADFDRFNLFLRTWSRCRVKHKPTSQLVVPHLQEPT